MEKRKNGNVGKGNGDGKKQGNGRKDELRSGGREIGKGKKILDKKDSEKKKEKKKEVLCPYFKKCGACRYLDLPYDRQLRIKQRFVEKEVGGFCKVFPIKGMKEPFHYRNKVHAVFDRDSRGNILSGVYKEGTHKVVSIDSCLLEDENADRIILTIRGMLKSFKIKTYDEDTGYGLLRHVMVRKGFATGQIMVVLVTASPIFPSKNNFVKALLKEHPEITTIVQNINEKQTSMVLGEREQVMYGKGYIEDVLCGITFRISSRSFYQVNPVQTEYLYRKAVELAGLTGKETVLDAYCGIGTIGMIAAAEAGRVIGVELNKDAVKDAVLNAKNNGIENIEFYCNDAGTFMERYVAGKNGVEEAKRNGEAADNRKSEKIDVVFMDPPRSGSSEKFMDSLARLSPEKIVYVSCNPETLARDLGYLKKKGYRAMGCYPVDMFCWTEHVEVVVSICRANT
jgi:23S rRNA (uracil1939-C5)-methyltransferase